MKTKQIYNHIRLCDNELRDFGTLKDGVILTVNESKLNLDFINQIRNYLNAREKQLKTKKEL